MSRLSTSPREPADEAEARQRIDCARRAHVAPRLLHRAGGPAASRGAPSGRSTANTAGRAPRSSGWRRHASARSPTAVVSAKRIRAPRPQREGRDRNRQRSRVQRPREPVPAADRLRRQDADAVSSHASTTWRCRPASGNRSRRSRRSGRRRGQAPRPSSREIRSTGVPDPRAATELGRAVIGELSIGSSTPSGSTSSASFVWEAVQRKFTEEIVGTGPHHGSGPGDAARAVRLRDARLVAAIEPVFGAPFWRIAARRDEHRAVDRPSARARRVGRAVVGARWPRDRQRTAADGSRSTPPAAALRGRSGARLRRRVDDPRLARRPVEPWIIEEPEPHHHRAIDASRTPRCAGSSSSGSASIGSSARAAPSSSRGRDRSPLATPAVDGGRWPREEPIVMVEVAELDAGARRLAEDLLPAGAAANGDGPRGRRLDVRLAARTTALPPSPRSGRGPIRTAR